MQVYFVILLFLIIYSSESKSDYDDFLAEEEVFIDSLRPNVSANKDLTKHLLVDRKRCVREETTWKCREECREQFLSGKGAIPGLCQKPIPGDVCFGSVVDFPYVANHKPFPLQFQVLENYPRCWSVLAPLICATHFRPCAIHKYALKDTNGSVEEGIVELWSQIRRSFCKKTISACLDVIRDGYFPEYIKCNEENTTAMAAGTFSDSCMIPSLPISFKFASKCPEPLVFVDGVVHGADPIHDSCYLKCRSGHIAQSLREYQMDYQTAVGLCLTLIFVIPFVYLYFCSEVHRRSPVVFCGSQAFISIAIYCFLWATAFLTFHLVECVEVGGYLLRANEPNTNTLHWCAAQSFLLHFAFTAAFLWLFAVSILGLCKPKCLTTEKYKGFQLRSILFWGIYLPSFLYAFILQQFHWREKDGVSGVCFPGLQSSSLHLAALLPLCLVSVASSAFAFFVYAKRAKNFDDAAIAISTEMTARFETQNRTRRTEFLQLKEVDDPTLDDLRKVDELALVEAEVNGNVRNQSFPQFASSQIGSRNEGFFSRRYRNFKKHRLNQYHMVDIEGAVTPSDALYEISAAEYASALCEKYEPYRNVWFNSFGFYWIAVSSVLAVVVLSASLAVHPFYISFDSAEELHTIHTYIKCGLDSSLRRGSIEWVYSNHSDLAFSSCRLQPYLPADRGSFIILSYLILPALPFLVLVSAMVSGCCGRGGMKEVGKTRWSNLEEELCDKVEAVSLPVKVAETNAVEIAVQTQNEEEVVKNEEQFVENPGTSVEPRKKLEGRVSENEDCVDEEEEMDQLGELATPRDLKKLRRNLSKERKRQHIINTLCGNIEQLLRNSNPNVRVERSFAGLMDAIQTLRKNSMAEGRYSMNNRLNAVTQLMATVHDYISYSRNHVEQNRISWSFILYLSQNTMQLSKLLMPEAQVPPEFADQYREALDVIRNILKFFQDVYPQQKMPEVTEMFGMWSNFHEDASERLLKAVEHVTILQNENNKMMAAVVQHTASAVGTDQSSPVATPPQQMSSQAQENNSFPDRHAAVCKIQHAGKRYPEVESDQALQPSKRVFTNSPLSNAEHQLKAGQFQSTNPAKDPNDVSPANTLSLCRHSTSTALHSHSHQHSPRLATLHVSSSNIPQLSPQETAHVGTKSQPSTSHVSAHVLKPSMQPRTFFGNSRPQTSAANSADQPGPSGLQENQRQQNGSSGTHSRETGVIATQSRTSNLTSAFDPAYNFANHGLITTFEENSMSLRITAIRSLTLTEFYPQEIVYMLVLTGDMRIAKAGEIPSEGESLIQANYIEEYFNTPERTYPQVDNGLTSFEFLELCRRRAIIFMGIVGDWFNRDGRYVQRSGPPRKIPAIDFREWNQIETIRVMTPRPVSAALEVLRRFDNGRALIDTARTDVNEIQWAGIYWDNIVKSYGLPTPERNIYVDDPAPSLLEEFSSVANLTDEPDESVVDISESENDEASNSGSEQNDGSQAEDSSTGDDEDQSVKNNL